MKTTFNRYVIISLFGFSLLAGCAAQGDSRSAPQSESRSKSSGQTAPPNITYRPGA